MRLSNAGSPSDTKGTVEIYHDERWNTICGEGWDLADATVVCRQLSRERGLGDLQATAYYTNARFGEGRGRVVMSNVTCEGDENELLDCANTEFSDTGCPHSRDAGVECQAKDSSKIFD